MRVWSMDVFKKYITSSFSFLEQETLFA